MAPQEAYQIQICQSYCQSHLFTNDKSRFSTFNFKTALQYINNVTLRVTEFIVLLQSEGTVSVALDSLPQSHFTEFKWTLFKGLSLVLCINLLLIAVSWRLFGKQICERFMKPATSKAIEELKASVSRLKLPKEHTPRI